MEIETLRKQTTEIKNEILAKISIKEFAEVIAKTKAASDSDAGTFEVAISTADLDRQGEVIKQEGIDTGNYMKNPVVLWGHDYYSLPIGVCDSVEFRDGKTIAKGRFAPEDANPFAQQVRRMYDAGMIKTTSVGIIPIESNEGVISRCELLEFSFVPVPANPYALSLRQMKELKIDLNLLVTKGMSLTVKADPAHGEDEDTEESDDDEAEGDEPNNAEALEHLREMLKSEHAIHTKNMDEYTTAMHNAIMGDGEKTAGAEFTAKSIEEFKEICTKAIEAFKAICMKEHERHIGELNKGIDAFEKEYPGDEEQNSEDPKGIDGKAGEAISNKNRTVIEKYLKDMKAGIGAIEAALVAAPEGDEGGDDKAHNKGRRSAGSADDMAFDTFLSGQRALRDAATIISESLEKFNKTRKEITKK